jgi:SAM-dependent methyltransferase
MTISPDQRSMRAVRRRAFATRHPLNPELLAWSDGVESHGFLLNPTGQNTYLYLCGYVVDVSEFHFGRKVSELRMLDWGAGKGHVSHLLRTYGARPVSCDLRTASADSAYGQDVPIIENSGTTVVALDDSVILPFETGSMDVVLSFGVLEHVQDDLGSLGEISRVLAPGGLFLCFNLPYTLSWTQRIAHLQGDRYHDRLYGRRQVTEMVCNAGFRVLDMWHRQLLPKNDVRYPRYQDVERVDQLLTEYTPLRYLATSLEFAAERLATRLPTVAAGQFNG